MIRTFCFLMILFMGCRENTLRDYNDIEHPNPEDIGCPDAEYPYWKNSKYVLPYPVGKTYRVDLNNCSGSYHAPGKPDQFAVDFKMDIGTIITAARGGEVVYVIEDGEDYTNRNNLVIVKHSDNTYGQYMHLTWSGAIVTVGDTIKKGDQIGLSGATGLAGYPHLHFVVTQDNYSWPYESIPINFKNTDENERGLDRNTYYTAYEY